jgi:hypothetical protein
MILTTNVARKPKIDTTTGKDDVPVEEEWRRWRRKRHSAADVCRWNTTSKLVDVSV